MTVWSTFGRRLVALPGVSAFTTFIGLGTAAFKNTGTSGDTVPLLDTAVTFSGTTLTLSNASQFFPQMIVDADYNGVAAGYVNFRKGRAGGPVQAADVMGTFIGQGRDSDSVFRNAAFFAFEVVGVASGGVSGAIKFVTVTTAGGANAEIYLKNGLYDNGATGTDKGVGSLNFRTLWYNGVQISPPGAPVTKTANFTVADSEQYLINNKSGSSCTVTLPSAASFPGRKLHFKNSQAQTVVSASSNVVPRVTAAAGTAILASGSGNWCKMVSDGTNWVIMAGS